MPPERRALIGMCVLIAVNQLGFGGIVPSLPLYAQSFGVSASAIGLAIAAGGLVLVGVLFGKLAPETYRGRNRLRAP